MTVKKTNKKSAKTVKKVEDKKTKKAEAKKADFGEQNIILIGFMGVGKGATARELAKQSKRFAVDCDDMIESFANKKIKKIFEEDGEAAFRRIEKSLAKFLETSVKGAIISTGGGFYAVLNLKKIGRVVYLKMSFNAIMKRIKNSPNAQKKLAKRPLLSNLKKARELFKARESEYAKKADFIIECEGKSEKKIAAEILNLISQKEQN